MSGRQPPRRRCAFLTMDDISGFVSDADLSVPALQELEWDVDFVSWRRRDIDWNCYQLVYICTPWDYQDDPQAYLDVLGSIERSSALLVNSLETVRWNLDKQYLRELETRGVHIVPSLWFEHWSHTIPETAFSTFRTDRVVVKPQVGANADRTFVVERPAPTSQIDDLEKTFASTRLFVQPFVDSVQSEGEYSVFYFGGDFSHAILKVPRPGDFRSQEEHGADIRNCAGDDHLRAAAEKALALVRPAPVYARADFVRGNDGEYLLMELELNEPALYFRMDAGSPRRFAKALTAAWATTA